jgi:uncharacterized protein (AIM24 family)
MYDVIGTRENIKIIDSLENGNSKVEVLEYQTLLGINQISNAQEMYFMSKQNVKARQVAFHINNDAFKIQPGAMSYFQGALEMVSGVTAGNAAGRFLSGFVTGERMAQPEYKGTGLLVSEPSFKHFYLMDLEEGQEAIVDKGMFYGAQGSVKFAPILQKNVSSALLGGEGLFQISLTGPGMIVLESQVPFCEVNIIELNNDVLKVDGSFAILRMGRIDFTVERSAKTLLGSAVSGEGLVNVFRGTGTVWLAPTIKVYDTMSSGFDNLSAMNMNTSKNK